MKRAYLLIVAAVVSAVVTSASAAVKPHCTFTDNAVLQRGVPLPVTGTADEGERVAVVFQNQKVSTVAKGGQWKVTLKPLQAGGPFEMTIGTTVLKNILVGDVWVCSGQSNMGFMLNRAHDAERVIPKANHPKIRLYTVPRVIAFEPQATCGGKWVECTAETAKDFTAVGYFFGRDIHAATGVPIGLINASWGGTPAQAWTSLQGLQSEPLLEGFVKSYRDIAANLDALEQKFQTVTYPKWKKDREAAIAKSRKAIADAKAAGKPAPPQPKSSRAPRAPKNNPGTPTVLYNAMIEPLLPFPIKGAIWYQGEANSGHPKQYQVLFPAMIKDWRRAWGCGDFPFLFVQLANYMKRETEPTQSDGGWPGLREAQAMTLKLPNTGMAVTIDIGEADDIHPRNKADVGNRLALAGLKIAYDKDIVFSGPTYHSMKVEGDKVRLQFQNTGSGLATVERLTGFAIAGADRTFAWAKATIDGNSVVVWSDAVKNPVAVRYAWANNPECNLYNKEGIPASPFRTDDWASSK
ncbi:MAG: sialate O-acetylesterase [Verrucomicrobia bacterium]|nr:sialate O-acetylesterase [Verrucomicrobiota bacterium]